jgi:hypothetical protein
MAALWMSSILLLLKLGASYDESKDKTDVYYVTKMADRFLSFTAKHEDAVNNFADSEQQRLASAITNAHTAHDKSLLEMTATTSEENRLEAENAFGEMRNFVTTLKQAIGAVGSATSCEDLTCGAHAHCSYDSASGARCSCKDGYQGNGFVCKTPMKFTAHALMQVTPGQPQAQIADIQVSTLQRDTIVAVYRNVRDDHRGYAMLGHVTSDEMLWRSPVLFSKESQAYNPVLVQLREGDNAQHMGGIAIAFRDMNRGGDGVLLGGRIDPKSGVLTLGSPRAFTRHQAQGMAILPVRGSRVLVFYSGHNPGKDAWQLPGGEMYGGVLLAQVHPGGAPPQVIHKARFAVGPVARISALQLSPTNFVVAYRQGAASPDAKQAEAACLMGRMHYNEVIFDSEPLLLEPEQSQIWARSMSLVGENTIAYTYYSGHQDVTKQAVIKADPVAHHLEIVHGPDVIAHGSTSLVGSVALIPDAMQVEAKTKGIRFLSLSEHRRLHNSRLLTYLDNDGHQPARARLCSVDVQGKPSGCQDLNWSGREVASASAAQVSDGRFVIAFTDYMGTPYYQVVGLLDPLL